MGSLLLLLMQVRHRYEILGCTFVSAVFSLYSTVIMGRALGLDSLLTLAIAPRAVTVALALPIAQQLQAAAVAGVTATAVCFEGALVLSLQHRARGLGRVHVLSNHMHPNPSSTIRFSCIPPPLLPCISPPLVSSSPFPKPRGPGGAAQETVLTCFHFAAGLMGASFAQPLLNKFGFRDPIVRGMSTAGAAHGLGTASLAANEPDALPFCALAYAIIGIIATLVSCVPFVRYSLFALAGAPAV